MIADLSLSPRQTRTALDLLTALVVISVAFALAGLTWRIAGHASTGAVTVPSGSSAPTVMGGIGPVLALAPFGKAAVSDASQPTALPLELKGVFAAQPASLSAAFIVANGEPSRAFRIGENVGGAVIEAILRDRVILNNAGRTEYLAFPDPTLTPEARAAAAQGQPGAVAATSPGGGHSTSAPTNVQPPAVAPPPPPAAARAAGGMPAGMLQRFNATPTDGGYRIGQNGPPGLLPGDVLVSVNGTALTDPSAASAAYAAAQQSGSATLQVMRDGKRMTLTVATR